MVTSRQSTNVLRIYNYHRFQMLQMELCGWHVVSGVCVWTAILFVYKQKSRKRSSLCVFLVFRKQLSEFWCHFFQWSLSNSFGCRHSIEFMALQTPNENHFQNGELNNSPQWFPSEKLICNMNGCMNNENLLWCAALDRNPSTYWLRLFQFC